MKAVLRIKIVIWLMGVMFSGCSNDLCSNTELQRVASPNGEYAAVIFSRNCGATTREAFHVSIMMPDEKLGHSTGNVYTAYNRVSLDWNGDHAMTINGSAEGDDVLKAKHKYKKIAITYLEHFFAECQETQRLVPGRLGFSVVGLMDERALSLPFGPDLPGNAFPQLRARLSQITYHNPL